MKYSIEISGLLTAMPPQQLNWLFIRRILVQLKTVWLNVFVTLQSGSQWITVLASENLSAVDAAKPSIHEESAVSRYPLCCESTGTKNRRKALPCRGGHLGCRPGIFQTCGWIDVTKECPVRRPVTTNR